MLYCQIGVVEISIDLEFNISACSMKSLEILSEITVEENSKNNLYSMVIYFVKRGDTLWKIAKRFKSTVEDIARVNEIENTDKIQEGIQLYIPKYVKRTIAI